MGEKNTTLFIDTFNTYNKYQQEALFLNQKYARFFRNQDSEWIKNFQEKMNEYGIKTDEKEIRENGLLEVLYQLDNDPLIDVLNTFFWIENGKITEDEEEQLNNALLSGFLSDINRYKIIKKEIGDILSDETKKAIILRMGKLIKKDLMKTLKTDKRLLDDGEKITYTGKNKFSRKNRKGVVDSEESLQRAKDKELHEKFTTSILTFHEIEKLYQKYNYVFTLRDIKDAHIILNALRGGEMVLMTGDTGSGKTELSLLIANLYLDEVYGEETQEEPEQKNNGDELDEVNEGIKINLRDYLEGLSKGEKVSIVEGQKIKLKDNGEIGVEVKVVSGNSSTKQMVPIKILDNNEVEPDKLKEKDGIEVNLRDYLKGLSKGEKVRVIENQEIEIGEDGVITVKIEVEDQDGEKEIIDLPITIGYKEKKQSIREKKVPILVTGNSDTDFSDLTVEKIITSKNAITNQNDIVFGTEQEKTNAEDVFGYLMRQEEVQEEIRKIIDAREDITGEQKEKYKEKLKNYDMFKYNLFTEFHLQGIVKAMENGVPLILDEINGISPEVLLGLNHYFTRKVGQTISIGNGFKPILIKKGFCIICTGNDKNENSKVARYQGRYNIDESLLNRMYRICKGYYKQTVNTKDFNNENRQIETEEMAQSQIEYMNENELYGVILMLCFNKQGNDKDIKKISNSLLLKKMINTQTVGFNLIKESFKGKSVDESKKQVFNDLKNFARFIHYIQQAYQGQTVMLGKDSVKLNNSSFSMRQLVSIIKNWKSDTKSLWFHIYNNYVRQIPSENNDRYRIYRIAQEVGFINQEEHLENKPEIMQTITNALERRNNEEYHAGANTRNAHIKETNIDESLLDSQLIITKQDLYTEYFGGQFGNIDDNLFEEEIEEEKNNLVEEEGISIAEESIEDIRDRVIVELDGIGYFLNTEGNDYTNLMGFAEYFSLRRFCTNNDGEYPYVDTREKGGILESVDKILGQILEKFQDGQKGNFDGEGVTELVQQLKKIGGDQ